MNKKKSEDSNRSFIIISIIVTIVIIGAWFITLFWLKGYENRGTFGDMFGSINALFSGLALAGIIITILLQSTELRLQRDELKETRKEFKTQNETLKVQRFENTFFSLLNQHHQIVNSIDYRYYKNKEAEFRSVIQNIEQKYKGPPIEKEVVIINGRDVFRFRYDEMYEDLIHAPDNYVNTFMKHYGPAQTDFGHYFRNLYRMIKQVDQTDFFSDNSIVSEKETFEIKYKYTSIIRAQISDYELLWIFYNCLSSNGIEKFKPYIEKYSFFKNIPKNLLADPKHEGLYKISAYIPEK